MTVYSSHLWCQRMHNNEAWLVHQCHRSTLTEQLKYANVFLVSSSRSSTTTTIVGCDLDWCADVTSPAVSDSPLRCWSLKQRSASLAIVSCLNMIAWASARLLQNTARDHCGVAGTFGSGDCTD